MIFTLIHFKALTLPSRTCQSKRKGIEFIGYVYTEQDNYCKDKCSLIDIFNDTVIIEQREERDKADEESKRQEAVDEKRDLMVKNTLSQQIRIISCRITLKCIQRLERLVLY